MNKFTTLAAVNRMFRGAGMFPISSIQDSTLNETQMAQDILKEVTLEYQLQGIYQNTFVRDLSPEEDTGHILLPAKTLFVQGFGQDRRSRFSVIGSTILRLYDIENETDVFDRKKKLRIVELTDFEDLPAAHQSAITDQAAVEFQQNTIGDAEQTQMLMQKAAMSRVQAAKYDIRSNNFNHLRTSQSNHGRRHLRTFRRWR